MGKERQHLKLRVRDRDMAAVEAVYWGAGHLGEHLHVGDTVDLCYQPERNEFNGNTRLQFNIKDLRLV